MFRSFLCVLFLATAGAANAQGCPDFFRFVDFGLQDAEGRFIRGGPHFRGESLAGTSFLKPGDTKCRSVREIASDGHGNPIPVVTHISYNVERTDLDLTTLHVSYSTDTRVAAQQNAQQHHARLSRVDAEPIRGENSLCVAARDGVGVSCQLVSPYPGNTDLVVHCDQDQCDMPVLAVNANIMVSAVWPVTVSFRAQIDGAGPQIFSTVQAIHAFLEPLSSGL